MRSPKLKPSPANNGVASDFVLPRFEEPMIERWPCAMSWAEAMRHFAPFRDHYMRHFDSPEKRLRDKNPERFHL